MDFTSNIKQALDHVTITEFHGLGTLSTKLAGDYDFYTLRGGLHDEADDAVAGTTDGKTTEELELERFGLSLGAKTAILDALSIELDSCLEYILRHI